MREDRGTCLLLKEWFDLASGSPVGLRTIYLLAWDSVGQLRVAMSEQGSRQAAEPRAVPRREARDLLLLLLYKQQGLFPISPGK